MSKVTVTDVELTDVEEIFAAAEVEAKAGQLIHDWQTKQSHIVESEIVPAYIFNFNDVIKQTIGEEKAKNFVTVTMFQFIATVMANIAAVPICNQIEKLSKIISDLKRSNLIIKETYEVMSPTDKMDADIDIFFNTEKIKMAEEPLLMELKKLSPKKPKMKKDRCVVMGGSKRNLGRKRSRKNRKRTNKKRKSVTRCKRR